MLWIKSGACLTPLCCCAKCKQSKTQAYSKPTPFLKTLDTIGNCQRPVFSLGVSQHMHKITNLWKFELNWLSKLRDKNKIKNTLVTRSCVRFKVDFETSNSKSEVSKSNSWKNYFFLKNYVTSEGAVSHNVLYHQPLPITRHQVRFYANNYFE